MYFISTKEVNSKLPTTTLIVCETSHFNKSIVFRCGTIFQNGGIFTFSVETTPFAKIDLATVEYSRNFIIYFLEALMQKNASKFEK